MQPADFCRRICPFFVFVVLFLFWHFAPPAESARRNAPESGKLDNYDIRTDASAPARAKLEQFVARAGKTPAEIAGARKKMTRAASERQASPSSLRIEASESTRNPEVIAPADGGEPSFLTAPTSEKRDAVLRRYLKQNQDLFGLSEARIDALRTTADYANPDGNLAYVHLEQSVGGISVFRGEVKAGFTKRGEIVRIINNLAPLFDDDFSTEFGAAESAVEAAAKHISRTAGENDLKRIAVENNELKVTFGRGQFDEPTTAEKMYFPVENGLLRPSWRVLLWTENAAYYVIVDAADGTLLWRQNIVNEQMQPATYEVYGNATSMMKTADSPAPSTPGCNDPGNCPQPPIIARQQFTLVGNEAPYTFNNNGWIPDGENRTIGNNAEAGIDRDGTQGVDPQGYAFGNPNRNFVFVYNPAPGNPPPGEEPVPPAPQPYPPSQFQQGSVTNAFYVANRYHDELYRLGFTEQARNFQTDNFGRGGAGNDSISVEVQDSSGTNSANFASPADGGRGRLQLFVWTGPTPDRDGALDNQWIVHELTHGVSNRLHGNSGGLTSNFAAGMGEGWSDFYALALLSEPTDDVNGIYTVGCYQSAEIVTGFTANCYYGIRRFPYARVGVVGPNGKPHNPLTFRYLNADCNTLIGTTTSNPPPSSAYPRGPIGVTQCDQVHNVGEVWAAALWEVRGFLVDTHGAAEGNRRALQYVTDGMKLAPLNPNFLQERDAIIAATAATNPGDVPLVRRGFARRGMGFSASVQSSSPISVTEAFDELPNVSIGAGFAASDAPGNNNGSFEPGETIALTVPLTNNTGATVSNVVLSVANGGAVAYGDIANGQTVTRTVNMIIPTGAPCPGNYAITLNINSSLGSRTETRSIFIGTIQSSNTFTSSTPVTIPASGASAPYGTTVNVSGILNGPKRVKLEITGITHTFPGDLDFLLVSPAGQKFTPLSDSGDDGDVSDLTFTLSDDAAAQPSTTQWTAGEFKPVNVGAGDTFPAPAPAGPYLNAPPAGTASFASAFNSDGTAMNGTWTLYVVDDASGDGGSMAGWKLKIETVSCAVCFCLNNRRADFDGDGKTDLSVFRPSEGNWYLNRSAIGFGVVRWGVSGDAPAPGDYDADGKTDYAVWRPNADAEQPDFYVFNSSSSTVSALSWGLPGDVPVVGDYDGDNRADYAVFRPSNHTFYVRRSNSGSVLIFSGIASGTPVAGDFDGDGKDDFATYETNGWYAALSGANYSSVNFTRWGAAGDKPVAGDYDGDLKDDFAVFRPSNGTWYILRSSDGGASYVQFGLADDVLVPGDYDGDGRMDAAVYRSGTWYINRSASGILITQFGLGTDKPIPNGYLP